MQERNVEVAFLAAFVLPSVLGGVVSAVVLLERIRMRLIAAALLGFVGALMIYSTPGAPPMSWLVWIIVVSVGGACLFALLVSGFYLWAPEIRSFLRSELIPHAWGHPGAAPLPAKALVTRWFITIAASTGSVVGALMIGGEFWRSAQKAIELNHILFTLLITVVSVTLIGPLEEYVFGQRLSRISAQSRGEEESSGNLVTDVWENFSWRAAGRLGLVALFSFQPTILHASLDDAISGGDVDTILTILSAAVSPAFTTYYWCAALQRGERSVARRAGRAATLFSAMLSWPTVLGFCVAVAIILITKHPVFHGDMLRSWTVLGVLVLVSPLVSIVLGFLLDGVSAFVGGWIIEFTRRTPALNSWLILTLIGLALSAIPMLLNLIVDVGDGFFLKVTPTSWKQWVDGPLIAFGWMAGLAVSGFPKILSIASPASNPQPDSLSGSAA